MLAKSEGHRSLFPIDQRIQKAIQENGRKGSVSTQRLREAEGKGAKARKKALFLARKHPPLMVRHLVQKHGMSESYARDIIKHLATRKLIKQSGVDQFGAKQWVLA